MVRMMMTAIMAIATGPDLTGKVTVTAALLKGATRTGATVGTMTATTGGVVS